MEFTAISKGGLKTTVKADGTTVVWSKGDAIKVFTAKDTQGGECTLTDGAETTTAVFNGQCSETGPWTAIYPSSMAKSFAEGVITFTVPILQKYADGTFAKGTMPSVAYSNTTGMEFKHAFGVLKLRFKGEGYVKYITVTDKNGAKLNGTFAVTPKISAVATKSGDDGSVSTTLYCGEDGIALNASTAVDFWIVVPEGAFAGGFDIVITDTDNRTAELSTTQDNTIIAGEIKPMPEKEIVFQCACGLKTTVKGVSGYDYPLVSIGDQCWMAENVKETEYDTESEGKEKGVIINSSWEKVLACYENPTNIEGGKPGYMFDEQWQKLGLLYNWAAVVGFESTESTETFTGKRQGICPNGFHVPGLDEYTTLKNFIEDRFGEKTAAAHIKTSTGWRRNAGTELLCGFSALPAGSSAGVVVNVGSYAYLWTSTPKSMDSAHNWSLYCDDTFIIEQASSKFCAYSVRCIMNKD